MRPFDISILAEAFTQAGGMAQRSYPPSKVYGLLEPGPVVLLSTTHKGRANVMTMSWHTMMEFEPPLVKRYNFFVLEVLKAWIDPACKNPRTLHHRGRGALWWLARRSSCHRR